jgi:hypothetical protein
MTLDEILKTERRIGLKASRMIQKSIQQEIRKHNLFSGNVKQGDELSLLDSVKTTPKMGKVRLFKIQTTMARHGFIIQHGVNTNRSGHIRAKGRWRNEREAGGRNKSPFTNVSAHPFKLTAIAFIEDGIEKSGGFDIIFNELGALRMQEVKIMFKKNGVNIT